MLAFPDEEAQSAAAQRALAAEFDFARRVYNFWLSRRKARYVAKSTLDERVISVAMMLSVQACREYRTIVDLCKRCEAYTAGINARSLFETALAMAFVLKPVVRIRIIQSKPGEYRAILPNKGLRRKSDVISREQRALLYLSNMALEGNVFAMRCSRKYGRKQYGKTIGIDKKLVSEAQSELGPEWAYVLTHHPYSYSGLSVSDLARAVGSRLDHWYDTVYFFQSRLTHSSSAIRHVTERKSGRIGAQWLSPLNEISGSFRTGTAMLLVCLSLLDEHIGFGSAMTIAMHSFRTEFLTLFGER